MDYRKIAIDKLRRVESLRSAQRISRDRISELRAALASARGTHGKTPVKNGGNKIENRWLSIIASIDEETQRSRQMERELWRFETAFNAITKEEQRVIISSYIEGRPTEAIMATEHCSRATAYRKQEEALENFARAYFGTVIT